MCSDQSKGRGIPMAKRRESDFKINIWRCSVGNLTTLRPHADEVYLGIPGSRGQWDRGVEGGIAGSVGSRWWADVWVGFDFKTLQMPKNRKV